MTAERVDILDGEWVVFRDGKTVTNRQRRPFNRTMAKVMAGADLRGDADLATEYALAVAFMFVADWSFAEPLPTDWDLFCAYLEDEPGIVMDAINIEAARYLMAENELKVAAAPKVRKAAKVNTST